MILKRDVNLGLNNNYYHPWRVYSVSRYLASYIVIISN